jgi:predicted nucleotidyltransferase
MSEKEIIKSQLKSLLEKLFNERGISISKIIIFGSFAENKLKEDSDIDVIVVSRDFREKGIFERVKMISGIGRELVQKFKIPFDLILYSDEEWETQNYLLILEAREKGEVIYSQ